MTNSSKLKCGGRGRAELVICKKINAHKLFIHFEFHFVRYLTKIKSKVVKLISAKFSVVLQ